jgi:hypothetical protein
MRTRFLAIAAICCAAGAAASTPKIWTIDSARDFSEGTAHGVSALPDGRLALTRESKAIAGLSATKIFAVAAEKSGALLFASGDEGQIFRQEPGKPATVLLTLPESEVTALAAGPDGAIYAGTSPHGKVYRIEKGKPLVYFEPQAEYIWAFAFDRGSLFVATGVPGRIFRVTAPGEGRVFDDVGDEHVRCLLMDAQGRLWAGTSGKGLVIRIAPDGVARTIYDSEKAEISSLAAGPEGQVWAAAVSTKVGGGPAGAVRPPVPAPKEKKPEASASPGGGEGGGTVTVTATTSLVPPAPPSAPSKGGESSEIVEIGSDDAAVPFWRSDDELVHSCRWDPASGGLLVATGPHGRVYLVRKGQASLSASVDEKRVVFATDEVLATDSPASAYRRVPARAGEFFSSIKDTGRTSRFGAFRTDASVPKGGALTIAFRSGNSSYPDATWTPWTAPVPAATPGKIAAAPGRFLQWKTAFEAAAADRSPVLFRVECAYQNDNARPQVEAVAVGTPSRDAAGVFAAASTDEASAGESIFTASEEKPGTPRAEGRGYLIVTWKASDPDGDELVADVDFRPAGVSGPWVPMRRSVRGNAFGFDSRLLPDGRYLFRVTASDRPGNPDDPRSDATVSDPVLVDNTPPAITLVSSTREKSGAVLRVRVADALSPIAAAGWSVDAGAWTRAAADDGMTDSPQESYTISLQPEIRGAYVLVRAVDAAGNTSSLSIVAP